MKQSFKELLKYGLVGLVGLVVDWGIYLFLNNVLGVNYIVSHIISSILAITNNFLLNSYFTFKNTDKIWQRGVSFFTIAGVGLVVGSALLPVFVKLITLILQKQSIELDKKMIQNLAKLIITIIIAFLQFFLNKYLTFRRKTIG